MHDPVFTNFDSIPVCDRQRDRQTCLSYLRRAPACQKRDRLTLIKQPNPGYNVTTLETMWYSPTVRGTPAHVKCCSYHAGTSVIVNGVGRNATVHVTKTKMKCTSSAKSRMDANIQPTINSFRPLFSDKIISPTLPWHFPDSCQIPWHFQVFRDFPDKWSPCG